MIIIGLSEIYTLIMKNKVSESKIYLQKLFLHTNL